jgi:hypothetical protein
MALSIESIHFGGHRVDRHHPVVWNTHSIFPNSYSYTFLWRFHWCAQCVWFLMHSCWAIIDAYTVCSSTQPDSVSHHQVETTLSHRFSLDDMWGAAEVQWWTVWLVALLFDHIMNKRVLSCTSIQRLSELNNTHGGHYCANIMMHLEAMTVPTGRLCLHRFEDSLGVYNDSARLEY